MTNKQALWLSERPVRCFSLLSYLSNYRPTRYHPICTEELREGELRSQTTKGICAICYRNDTVKLTSRNNKKFTPGILFNLAITVDGQILYHLYYTYFNWSLFKREIPYGSCWQVRNVHLIFWLNFNQVKLTFDICIFASNTNKNMQNLKVWISEVFRGALLIIFSSITSLDVTPAEFQHFSFSTV